MVNNIRTWLVAILVAVATLFLTIGGLRLMWANGDPGEAEKGKAALKSAAIGYALALLAPLIVTIVGEVGEVAMHRAATAATAAAAPATRPRPVRRASPCCSGVAALRWSCSPGPASVGRVEPGVGRPGRPRPRPRAPASRPRRAARPQPDPDPDARRRPRARRPAADPGPTDAVPDPAGHAGPGTRADPARLDPAVDRATADDPGLFDIPGQIRKAINDFFAVDRQDRPQAGAWTRWADGAVHPGPDRQRRRCRRSGRRAWSRRTASSCCSSWPAGSSSPPAKPCRPSYGLKEIAPRVAVGRRSRRT